MYMSESTITLYCPLLAKLIQTSQKSSTDNPLSLSKHNKMKTDRLRICMTLSSNECKNRDWILIIITISSFTEFPDHCNCQSTQTFSRPVNFALKILIWILIWNSNLSKTLSALWNLALTLQFKATKQTKTINWA